MQRLVRSTIEEPVRERWKAVETAVFQLRESGRKKDRKAAEKQLREFHEWPRNLHVLDPACGSGNFLYMALAALKRVEAEVLHTLEDLTGNRDLVLEEVGPWQFHGIEIKPWAREIAELTLWIGYFQFWMAHHGQTRPPQPVLRDTGTLEARDALLTWDKVEVNPDRAIPDPTPKVQDLVGFGPWGFESLLGHFGSKPRQQRNTREGLGRNGWALLGVLRPESNEQVTGGPDS